MELFDKSFFQHLMASFLVKGLFETDKEGKITGINPNVREKIGPSFLGLNKAEEIIASQVVASLKTGERTIWHGLMMKLKPHQKTQLRILLAGLYKEFDLETAKGVAHSFLAIQSDDDDRVKIALLIESGIITESSFDEDAGDMLERIFKASKKYFIDAVKAIDDFVDSYHKSVNQPLENLLVTIRGD